MKFNLLFGFQAHPPRPPFDNMDDGQYQDPKRHDAGYFCCGSSTALAPLLPTLYNKPCFSPSFLLVVVLVASARKTTNAATYQMMIDRDDGATLRVTHQGKKTRCLERKVPEICVRGCLLFHRPSVKCCFGLLLMMDGWISNSAQLFRTNRCRPGEVEAPSTNTHFTRTLFV